MVRTKREPIKQNKSGSMEMVGGETKGEEVEQQEGGDEMSITLAHNGQNFDQESELSFREWENQGAPQQKYVNFMTKIDEKGWKKSNARFWFNVKKIEEKYANRDTSQEIIYDWRMKRAYAPDTINDEDAITQMQKMEQLPEFGDCVLSCFDASSQADDSPKHQRANTQRTTLNKIFDNQYERCPLALLPKEPTLPLPAPPERLAIDGGDQPGETEKRIRTIQITGTASEVQKIFDSTGNLFALFGNEKPALTSNEWDGLRGKDKEKQRLEDQNEEEGPIMQQIIEYPPSERPSIDPMMLVKEEQPDSRMNSSGNSTCDFALPANCFQQMVCVKEESNDLDPQPPRASYRGSIPERKSTKTPKNRSISTLTQESKEDDVFASYSSCQSLSPRRNTMETPKNRSSLVVDMKKDGSSHQKSARIRRIPHKYDEDHDLSHNSHASHSSSARRKSPLHKDVSSTSITPFSNTSRRRSARIASQKSRTNSPNESTGPRFASTPRKRTTKITKGSSTRQSNDSSKDIIFLGTRSRKSEPEPRKRAEILPILPSKTSRRKSAPIKRPILETPKLTGKRLVLKNEVPSTCSTGLHSILLSPLHPDCQSPVVRQPSPLIAKDVAGWVIKQQNNTANADFEGDYQSENLERRCLQIWRGAQRRNAMKKMQYQNY